MYSDTERDVQRLEHRVEQLESALIGVLNVLEDMTDELPNTMERSLIYDTLSKIKID